MAKEVLDEREFELVNIIGKKLGSNQRDLAVQLDTSLGMVNMLIRRLISKGFIRIHQLDKRKVEYILTPKGFAEKMKKSIKYTLNTINAIGLIKTKLRNVLEEPVRNGERHFILLGESDFASLVEIVLNDLCKDGYNIEHIQQLSNYHSGGFLLICKELDKEESQSINGESINIVELLANDYALTNQKGNGK